MSLEKYRETLHSRGMSQPDQMRLLRQSYREHDIPCRAGGPDFHPGGPGFRIRTPCVTVPLRDRQHGSDT